MRNEVLRVAVRGVLRAAAALSSERLQGTLLASLVGMAVPSVHAQQEATPVPPQQGAPAAGTDARASEEVLVTAVRFKSTEPVTALKLPVSVKDTPQTVMAVTGDVIDFASIKTFQDVYKVDASGGTSHSHDSFPRNYYRGFFKRQDNNAIRIDGFRMPADLQLDLEPYERFEIVKGPVSTLYGQNSIGGVLNAISKEPQSTFGGQLGAETGSFDHMRVTADLYGPLNDAGTVQYRLVGAWLDEESFLDLGYKKVKLLSPTLKLELSDDTSLTARVNYQDHRFRYHFGNGVQCLCSDLSQAQPGDFVIQGVDRAVFFGQEWNRADKEAVFGQTAFEHRFANDWMLRIGAQFSNVDEYSTADSEQAPDSSGVTLYGALYTNEKEDTLYAGEVQLYGDFHLGGTRNTLYFGADYQDHRADFLQGFEAAFTGFNVFAPRYDIVPPRAAVSDYRTFFNNINKVEEFGLTAQVFLRPVEALTLSLGTRYSDAKLTSDRRAGFDVDFADFLAQPFTRFTSDTTETTFQAGITYAVTPSVNLYASYGQTFEPQVGVFVFDPANPLGRRAPPEEGEAYEIGAKGEFLDRRLSVTLALFDMERSNLTQPRPGTSLQDVLGSQVSRGAELEVQGSLLQGLNVFVSLAAMDPKYEGGRFDGLQSANGAKFGASAFATYELPYGLLRGLGFGAGVVHKSRREFFGSDRRYADGRFAVFDFGSFTELDARVFYDAGQWRIQLGGTNLTNEKYYSPPRDVLGFGVHVNPPRAWNFKVTRRIGGG